MHVQEGIPDSQVAVCKNLSDSAKQLLSVLPDTALPLPAFSVSVQEYTASGAAVEQAQ